MKSKTLISTVLLGFVAASVAYLAFGEAGRGSAESGEAAPGEGEAATGAAADDKARVIAYYFHGSIRCQTCTAIEDTARKVIEQELGDELASGALRWRSVDFEQPENEHFVSEFEITASSLVLVKETGGEVARWETLGEVWNLIGDDERFGAYVLDHARAYLEES